MEGLLYWGLFGGLIGAILGKYFRNHAGGGALLGLLLGPLGWVLVFVLKDNRFKCPHCRSPVVQGATVCRSCGRDIDPSTYQPSPSTGQYAVSATVKKAESNQILWALLAGLVVLAIVMTLIVRFS